jgi:NhaP-type Na+/H+ or K+/H+ antiporter
VTDTIYALLAIAMVLTVVSLLVPLAERFRLPHTVLLAIAGMGLGFLGSWIISTGTKLGALGDAFVGLDKLEVETDMFLPLFLPPLLFNAGLTIDVRRLLDEVWAVLLLAIVAVLVCIAIVGAAARGQGYLQSQVGRAPARACCAASACGAPSRQEGRLRIRLHTFRAGLRGLEPQHLRDPSSDRPAIERAGARHAEPAVAQG